MGSLSNYVTLTITQNSVGITRAGFGVPMVLSATAAWSTDLIRFYSDLNSVATDFPPGAIGPPAEYLAAQALFSQSPAPTSIAIGKSGNKPTLVYQLTALTPTSFLNQTYLVNVVGQGVTPTQVTFTSDGTPTDAEWAAGMVTALNAGVGKNFTATGAASPVTITANSAGAWFSIEVVNVTLMKVKATHVDPGVAADLTAINLQNPNWYALYTLYNSKPYSIAAAAYIESAGLKIYMCESNDTESIITATGNAELLDTIFTNAYTRTAGFYHPAPNQCAAAALLGRCLPIDPGGVTFFGKTLAGISPVALTDTQRTNLVSRRASSYETVSGVNITFGGQVGSSVTGYIDVRRNLDWLQDDMTKAVFGAIVANNIVPYTDGGIGIIEAEVRGSLKRAVDRGIFVDGSAVVTVPLSVNVPSSDKIARTLNNVKFSGPLQGAIHKVAIVGTVST